MLSSNGTDLNVELKGEADSPSLILTILDEDETPVMAADSMYPVQIGDKTTSLRFTNGQAMISGEDLPEKGIVYLKPREQIDTAGKIYFLDYDKQLLFPIPFWLSLLPPIIAIAFALIFREVFISLFVGIWAGAFIALGMQPELILKSLVSVVDTYFVQSLQDTGHISVIIFSLLIGGMVAIISRNGGMAGIVRVLSRYAKTKKSSQFITWLLGVAIFFDDYANTLIVGNTMKSVTDRYYTSREKLAYIVDSTAAPIAAVAFITTWIGAELGYIGNASEQLGIEESPYSLFLNSLFYSFYPIFTLGFVLMLIFMRKDYGPMYKAEYRSGIEGKLYAQQNDSEEENNESLKELQPLQGIPHRWFNALIPILVLIFGTITGLIITGYEASVWNSDDPFMTKLSETIGQSDSYSALMWSSLFGVIIALLLTFSERLMKVNEGMDSLMEGIKTMIPTMIVLLMAWSLAATTEELYTAEFLVSLFSGNMSPYALPAITFLLAAAVSFSTGSSWGTMAILYPLVLPSTWVICQDAGLSQAETMPIFYNAISVVLAGSVFGDHCSPISDTTVLSSLSSSCNHIDHVRTQLPYAITVGLVSLLAGGVLFSLRVPWYLNYLIGFVILYLVVRFLGKRSHHQENVVG